MYKQIKKLKVLPVFYFMEDKNKEKEVLVKSAGNVNKSSLKYLLADCHSLRSEIVFDKKSSRCIKKKLLEKYFSNMF